MTRAPKTQPATSAKAYQVLPVTDLTAGLDLRSAQTLMETDRGRRLVNWSLEQPGALTVRPGYVTWSTTSLGSGRLQGAQRIYLNTAIPAVNSTAFVLEAFGGSLYLDTDSGGRANSSNAVLTGLSSVNEIHFVHDRDLVAEMDGSTTPFKSTNGLTWTRMGIAAGTVASTLGTNPGGTMSTSEFEIGYVYKDRDLATESNGSTSVLSTITLGSSSLAIQVNVPNSTDPQVDAIVIYARNKTAGESIRRRASSGPTSTGVSSTIFVTSSNWTANDEEPTDHTRPPVLSFGAVWKNRWWGRHATIKNRLHFTQLFQPQSWPALFYIDIPFERGDEIRAVMPLGDTLLLLGTTKIFVIVGQTSLDFEVRPTIDSQGGTFGPRSVCRIENGIVHLDATGALIFDGASDRHLSTDLDPGWRDLVKNSPVADLQRMHVVYDAQRRELRAAVPRRFPSGVYGEWVLDLARTRQADDRPAWTETDRPWAGYVVWDGPEAAAGDRGRIFAWHSSLARLYEESTGTTANSSQIVAEYEGPGLTLGHRRARWIDLAGEYEPHAGAFSVEPVVDGQSLGTISIDIGAGQALYGTALYGTAQYAGSGRRRFYTPLPITADGRTFVLKAVYSGMAAFKWFTYQLGLVPEHATRNFGE